MSYSPQKVLAIIAVSLLFAACHTRRHIESAAVPGALATHTPAIMPDGAPSDAASPTLSNATPLPEDESGLGSSLLAVLSDSLFQTSQLGLSIIDVSTGEVLLQHNARQRMRPASAEKVVTAIAALNQLGPNHKFRTQLLTKAKIEGGTLQGDLYLKASMDPILTAADVRTLASHLKVAGISQVRGRIVTDSSMKDTDKWGWGWCWDDENPDLSPLLVAGKPALATALQNALRGAGVKVSTSAVVRGVTPADARPLAAVSHSLTEVLKPMLKESDNLCAEAVFYQLGPTRKNIDERIRACLPLAPDVTIADGSGLSLYNYQTAESFTNLLMHAVAHPDSILTPLLASLPIAAVDGTLKRRMADTYAAANLRAKTGSVTAVSTLVGFTRQQSTGHLIAFAILNQGVRTMAEARQIQDRICVLLSQ